MAREVSVVVMDTIVVWTTTLNCWLEVLVIKVLLLNSLDCAGSASFVVILES